MQTYYIGIHLADIVILIQVMSFEEIVIFTFLIVSEGYSVYLVKVE